ncbi:MAG: hypothetical protein LBF70_02550 [Holosporales bacterium]|jgi:CNT family concentrative nucleoside transporter|nr:hypothetical protein [Holosporales bacterium]
MLRPVIGYILFLAMALYIRQKKGYSDWKIILIGIISQIIVAFAILNLPFIISFFEYLANGILKMRDATLEGTKFAFGYIGGGDSPFEIKENCSTFVFAFQALPNIILTAAMSAILAYFKVLPFLAKGIGYVFKWLFRIRESISMLAAAKIFLGQCEAPLLIRSDLEFLRRSEIFIMLALAFSTASVSVMPIYADCIKNICPDAMQHIIMSSIMGVISTLLVCSIIIPNEESEISNQSIKSQNSGYNGFIEAMSKGVSDGAFIWWCIVGSLIGTVALLSIINYILATLPNWGGSSVTLQRIFGIFMYPFAWLLGVQSADIQTIAQILGTKLAINETIAFFDLAKSHVSHDSVTRTIYAIMNFGNFATIGITVGAMRALIPSQTQAISQLIWKAFFAGFIAVGLSSSIMSIFLRY